MTVVYVGTSASAQQLPADPAEDVTALLNEWFNNAGPDTEFRFSPAHKLHCEGTVYVEDPDRLRLRFNGATLYADTTGSGVPVAQRPAALAHKWPRHRAHLFVKGGDGIVISGLRVRGANKRGGLDTDAYVEMLEAQHAVELDSVRNAHVGDCDLSYTYGDGIVVARSSASDELVRNRVHHTGRQGISVTGGRDIWIHDCHLDQIRRSAFDVEPNASSVIEDVRITGNTVGRARLSFLAGLGRGSSFDGLFIEDNTATDMPLRINVRAHADGPRRRNVVVTDNRSPFGHGSTQAAFQFAGIDGLTVTGNHQPLAVGRRGLLVDAVDCTDVNVSGNSYPGGTQEVLIR